MPEILTNQQLKDACKCLLELECTNCSNKGDRYSGCTRKVAQTALTLYGIIAKIEWIKVNLGEFGSEIEMCPLCRNEKQHGHYENCDFNLIKTMGG